LTVNAVERALAMEAVGHELQQAFEACVKIAAKSILLRREDAARLDIEGTVAGITLDFSRKAFGGTPRLMVPVLHQNQSGLREEVLSAAPTVMSSLALDGLLLAWMYDLWVCVAEERPPLSNRQMRDVTP